MTTSIGSFNRPNQLTSCRVAMVGNLAGYYNNGPSNDGVKATLTNNGSYSALSIDGIAVSFPMRVLLFSQSNPAQNGLYFIVDPGSSITPWILQRVNDFQCNEQMRGGYTISIEDGASYAGNIFTLIYPIPDKVGIDPIIFVDQSGDSPIITGDQLSARLTSTANLTANYNNGASGVGATLTNSGTQAALTIDGKSAIIGDVILVQGQTDQTQNGLYKVTNVGSNSTNWVLTRTTNYDTSAFISAGNIVGVFDGLLYADTLWMQNTQSIITIGTSNVVFESLNFSPTLNYIYVDGINGNDTTGTGTQFLPYKTIPHAMANLPSTLTKDDNAVIFIAPGQIYNDNFTLKANVFIVCVSNTKAKLNGTININDASWSGQNSSGFVGCNLTNANTFDFTAQAGNTQGEVWFVNSRITANETFTMNASNFVRIWNCEGSATLTQSGGTLRSYNTSINAYIINGSATTTSTGAYINGGNIGQDGNIGALTVNSTSGAVNVFTNASVNLSSTFSITGASAVVYATSNAIPQNANVTLASSGTLTKLTDGYSLLPVFPSLQIASGIVINGVLGATATLDFPSISAQTAADLTITVTGARANNQCVLGLPSTYTSGLVYNAFVSANDTVTVRCSNVTSGAIDPASATFKVTVIQT